MSGNTGDVWFSRDLPFLLWVVPRVDANPIVGVTGREVANALGWEDQKVIAAVKACEYVFIEWQGLSGALARIHNVTPQARQLVGLWPTEDTFVDRMLEVAEVMIEADIDDAERSKWRAFRDGALSAGREVLVQIAAAAVTGHMPH